MNNQNQQPPINLKSILDMIGQSGNLGHIGRNKKKKLEKQLRQKLMMSGGLPASSSAMSLTVDDTSDDDDFENSPAVIELSGPPVRLDEVPMVYNASKHTGFDESLLHSPVHWHIVLILHQRKFEKRDILESLFSLVGDDLFAPFGYRPGREVDYFIVNNQGKALRKLFVNGLKFRVKGSDVSTIVKLGAGFFVDGQPKIIERIFACIEERMNSAALHGGPDVLDLSYMSQHEELRHMELFLGNKASLNLLADQLNGIDRIKRDFRVLKFASNGIRTLESFTKLFGFKIRILDLRHNQIPSVQEFHFLKHLDIEEIYLAGNDCVKIAQYRDKIFAIVDSLQVIDGQRKLTPASSNMIASLEALKKPKFKTGNGLGNDPILKIDNGEYLQGGTRRGETFLHLKNSFISYKKELDITWTHVIINNDNNYKFEEIMDEIMPKLFNNATFFPCYYKRMGKKDEFFLYKNFDALRSIMSHDLELVMPPQNEKITFWLKLRAAQHLDGQVDWFHKISHVLAKRITTSNILDLDNFTTDPEFSKLLVPMNSKANLSFIFEQVRKQNANIVRINAQNNGLTTLEAFQLLFQFPKLVSLDLRNNKISSLVGVCQTAGVKELLLDGNPICEKHAEPHAYVAEVKQHFLQLEYLDGHKLDKGHNLVTLQNFIVKRDAYVFADDFVKNYFNVYDSEDRRRIMQAYDQNSMFTLSCYFDSTGYQATAPSDLHMRIQRYVKHSRSINKISNMNQILTTVFYGLGNIDRVLNELPKTLHIYTTFSIDVPVYEPSTMVVLTVSGTFEDYGIQLNETTLLVAFTRTFVLRPSVNNPNEFRVSNEQLSIHCPTQPQREESTVGRKASVKDSFIEKHCRDLTPTEIEVREMKLMLFKELTEQKREVCLEGLENTYWDVKVALAIFNTLMDSGELPNDRFEFK